IVSYILDGSMTEQKLHFYDRALEKIDREIKQFMKEEKIRNLKSIVGKAHV
ncbi:hypothetical protein LCGC14_1129760, partial [marine sediment metagenome]